MTQRAPILVFDLDGTLADTAHDLIATLNVLLAREGLPLAPPASARSIVGAGARALIERGFALSGAPLPPDRVEPLVVEFLAHYEAHIADESRLFPGALAALDRFGDAGFKLAVCTNKPERMARLLLEKLGAADRFSAICGRGTFPMHKPDPRTLELTIETAGGDLARAVMVGDSKTDIDTAKGAGAPVVAVDFGYTEIPVTEFAPDRVISHFDELWAAAESILPPSAFTRT
ncbi:phosphoglycolate phosphatase [Methylocystis sp. MJC1]|uniref:HAD family hydrolase n=1 Tax=Methylocystis sp. MJC1 TaxID=2654282 RepID=UPI0013EC393F|nr:HAD family hydrolase [Methylocystis sp. MJC1]KAF2989010.1 Phosphoglycolate phosphatase [Methylocystis sp. MJC1]MBU6528278.1 phosphoglycolate phosphatase [Methylocystis sp. MJC1]UZX11185.1 phosphoglycolate phosphatase [Methylocystis sp. MJC1]